MSDLVVVRYHEIGLKGKNREFFENTLRNNLSRALKDLPHESPRRVSGRFTLGLVEGTTFGEVAERLSRVFGVANFSLSRRTDLDMQSMKELAWETLADEPFESFCIRARRSNRNLSFTSMDIEREVGQYVLDRCRRKVDLTNPDITCHIEAVDRWAFVSAGKLPGPGGLPIGVGGKTACLMSGGIDSPVAAYKLMRRGAPQIFVHFHGHPFTDASSQEISREVVRVLTRYQYKSKLYLVPFGEIQREVTLHCEAPYRILLYRRLMLRIAEAIAKREGALGLVTGDNLGQVASQTLENMASIDDAANMPVYRPLVGEDKHTIVELAQQIGTFELSTTPHIQDCCPLFMPTRPATHSSVKQMRKIEGCLDVPEVVQSALRGASVETVVS